MKYVVVDENNRVQHAYELDTAIMQLQYVGHTVYPVSMEEADFLDVIAHPGDYYYSGSVVLPVELKHNSVEGDMNGIN